MIINTVLAIFAYKMKALTLQGTLLALALGFLVYYCSLDAYVVLFLYFILITVIEKIVLKQKCEVRKPHQVLSNFLFALLALVMFLILDQRKYFVLYCTMLSVSIGDTLASTIGTRYARTVYSVIRFKKVTKGVSGGVSLCGSISGILGSGILALLYGVLMFPASVWDVLVILIGGIAGMIIDSVLGDLLQKKYYCKLCGKTTDNNQCCGNVAVPVGKQILTNTQVNIISEGIVFLVVFLLM